MQLCSTIGSIYEISALCLFNSFISWLLTFALTTDFIGHDRDNMRRSDINLYSHATYKRVFFFVWKPFIYCPCLLSWCAVKRKKSILVLLQSKQLKNNWISAPQTETNDSNQRVIGLVAAFWFATLNLFLIAFFLLPSSTPNWNSNEPRWHNSERNSSAKSSCRHLWSKHHMRWDRMDA